MTTEHHLAAEHAHFDSLCEGMGEYDALPTFASASMGAPAQDQPRRESEDGTADEADDASSDLLDAQILQALLSP